MSVSVWFCGRVVVVCCGVSCCVVSCVVMCAVCGMVWRAENPVSPLNTSPYVRPKRPRVYRFYTYTRGEGGRVRRQPLVFHRENK